MRLPALVIAALVVFAAALLAAPHVSRAASLHAILAIGAMPLIFGAMSHFIPVLTRSRAAPGALTVVPLLALAGGTLAVAGFMLPERDHALAGGALLALFSAATLLVWSRTRRSAMLGAPHPGLAWYDAALGCLIGALLAVLASLVCPSQSLALRRLHLHLNVLGFIALTAVGTLAVLVPTAVGRPDPQAAVRLRRDLPWALAGTLVIATGAAGWHGLSWAGAALWAIPLLRLSSAWLRAYRAALFAWHGATPLLGAALGGLAASLAFGAVAPSVHTLEPSAVFVVGFLLPLVCGAASQLLPVWLRPGVQGAWQGHLRARLGRWNGLRAVLFAGAGIASGFGLRWPLLVAAATLGWFLAQTAIALSTSRGSQT